MSSLATNPLGLVFYDDFQDPNVQRWENVSFADNYYQFLGNEGFSGGKTITPNGRPVENFDLNVSLSQDIKQGLPGRSGFTQDDWSLGPVSFGIGGPHSRVWRWYAGTVNLGIDHFESSEAKEPIFRRLLSAEEIAGANFGVFHNVQEPWYTGNGYSYQDSQAPWEGIGAGWFLSPQGGGQLINPPGTTPSIIVPVPVSQPNTEVSNPLNIAVPTIFNGDFANGNLHPLARFPLYDVTPGWFFHGGSFGTISRSIVPDGTGDYAVELNSISGGNAQITHNRFYVPTDVEFLEFDARIVDRNLQRTGQVLVSLSVEGGTPIILGSIELQDRTAGFSPVIYTVPEQAKGKTVTLKFQLQQLVPGPIPCR